MLQGPWPPGRPGPAGSCLHPVPTTSSHVASRKNRQMPSLSLLEGPHVLLGLVPWVLSERGCCCIGLWLTNSEPPPPLARGRRCRQPSAKKTHVCKTTLSITSRPGAATRRARTCEAQTATLSEAAPPSRRLGGTTKTGPLHGRLCATLKSGPHPAISGECHSE